MYVATIPSKNKLTSFKKETLNNKAEQTYTFYCRVYKNGTNYLSNIFLSPSHKSDLMGRLLWLGIPAYSQCSIKYQRALIE